MSDIGRKPAQREVNTCLLRLFYFLLSIPPTSAWPSRSGRSSLFLDIMHRRLQRFPSFVGVSRRKPPAMRARSRRVAEEAAWKRRTGPDHAEYFTHGGRTSLATTDERIVWCHQVWANKTCGALLTCGITPPTYRLRIPQCHWPTTPGKDRFMHELRPETSVSHEPQRGRCAPNCLPRSCEVVNASGS